MHYQVHNGSRDKETRVQRAERPTNRRLTQFVMDGRHRLVRGKPITVPEEDLFRHIEELRKSDAEGVLYVTTLDGAVVDLWSIGPGARDSMPASDEAHELDEEEAEPQIDTKPEEAAATEPVTTTVPEANVIPNMPLDDASRDKVTGVPMSMHQQEAPPPEEFSMPVPPPVAAVETPIATEVAPNPAIATEEPQVLSETAEAPVAEESSSEPVAPGQQLSRKERKRLESEQKKKNG